MPTNPPQASGNPAKQSPKQALGQGFSQHGNSLFPLLLVLICMIVGVALTAGGFALYGKNNPDTYRVSTVLEITHIGPEISSHEGLTKEDIALAAENFIREQIGEMTSDEILQQVIRDLDLVKELKTDNEEEAVDRVRTMLKVEDTGSKEHIRLSVTDSDKLRAAAIGSAVTDTYLIRRRALIERQHKEMLAKQIEEQEQRVRKARERAQKAMKDAGIDEPLDDEQSSKQSASSSTL